MSPAIATRLVLCLLVLLVVGCGEESEVGGDKGPATRTPRDGPDPPALMGEVVFDDLRTALDQWGDDDYELHTAGDDAPAIEGDTLALTVSYSGGCARHDFTLVADDPFVGRDPAELDVILAHDGNNDRCEAYPTVTYAFDLTPVRVLYRDTYGMDTGAVLLRFHAQDVPGDVPVAFFSLVYTLE